MYFDPLYLLLMLPALVLSIAATVLTRSRFQHYSQIPSSRGLRGADVSRMLLDQAGLRGVNIVEHDGFLTDHYDPRDRVVRLSPDVFWGKSLSSVSVAAHETGHALQHAEHYWPLEFRSRIVPLASFGSSFAYIIIMVGLVLHALSLAYFGVILFVMVVVFQLVTLPVEFDASARAKRVLFERNIVTAPERESVSKVLNAAALTYVAAAASALLTLLYFLLRTGLLGGRSHDER